MTAAQLKELETRLWAAADQLRANSKLTATEYSFPVLGLLFSPALFQHQNERSLRRNAEGLPDFFAMFSC